MQIKSRVRWSSLFSSRSAKLPLRACQMRTDDALGRETEIDAEEAVFVKYVINSSIYERKVSFTICVDGSCFHSNDYLHTVQKQFCYSFPRILRALAAEK